MKVTRIEVDGETYRVTDSIIGQTYCEECDLRDKCRGKENNVFPCDVIGDEQIFVKE